MWDSTGARWYFDPDDQLFHTEDKSYDGPAVVDPGAIPEDRQPFYSHPPSETEKALAELPEPPPPL